MAERSQTRTKPRKRQADYGLVLKVEDLCAILGVERKTAYKIARRAGFPALREGRLIRIPRDPFFAWLNAQKVQRDGTET